jgi:hypothetical protein
LVLFGLGPIHAATEWPGPSYGSPAQALATLVAAIRSGGSAEIETALGSDSKDLVSSGDPVADKEAQDRFIAAFDEKHAVIRKSNIQAVVLLGKASWLFPLPIVKTRQVWHFDAAAGREEVLDRRIGRNELNAIELCRTYVEAQDAYAADPRPDRARPDYAQRLLSSPGSRDGLYWPAAQGETQSPLGPLVASARAEGYPAGDQDQAARLPYHGYFFKILTRQGKAARGGAHDYIVADHMIGGFALVAFPARYGDSGIMSFIVNHDGVVFQKDLGPDSLAIAGAMTEFDPAKGWIRQK